jgi:uncharacterized protein (TIRG00374 family)
MERIPDAEARGNSREEHLLRIHQGVRFVVWAAVVWVVVLIAAATLVGDRAALSRLERAGPTIAALTLVSFIANHVIRFVRWQWMLHLLGARVPNLPSFAIFMAGLGLLPTPGKIGVASRSLLLLRHGVPMRTSLAAYFAERLFDLAGLLMLAAVFYRGPLANGITAVAVTGVVCIALLARYPDPFIQALRRLVGNRSKMLSAVNATAGLLHAAKRLLAFPQVLAFVLLGAIANVILGLLVYAVAADLAAGISAGTGIGAVAFAHLAGSASMSPGGLGGFEIALLLDLDHAGIPRDDALIVVTCVRIVTLWGGIAVGLPLMLSGLRRDRLEPGPEAGS